VGHARARDAHLWVAQWDVLERQAAEEGAAAAHDDRHKVDRHDVEQPELQTLGGDRARGGGDGPRAPTPSARGG
jgi:hypothetical protein